VKQTERPHLAEKSKNEVPCGAVLQKAERSVSLIGGVRLRFGIRGREFQNDFN